MFETALRSGEVIELQLDDIHLISRLITIRRGEGGRGRVIPLGDATTGALLVYLDEREKHPLAHTQNLWLGNRGKRVGREGLMRSLRRRAERVGLQGSRPPPAPQHRGLPLARRRRLRARPHGHRRLDPARHARPLHPRPAWPKPAGSTRTRTTAQFNPPSTVTSWAIGLQDDTWDLCRCEWDR